jgi:hypothetical protein
MLTDGVAQLPIMDPNSSRCELPLMRPDRPLFFGRRSHILKYALRVEGRGRERGQERVGDHQARSAEAAYALKYAYRGRGHLNVFGQETRHARPSAVVNSPSRLAQRLRECHISEAHPQTPM